MKPFLSPRIALRTSLSLLAMSFGGGYAQSAAYADEGSTVVVTDISPRSGASMIRTMPTIGWSVTDSSFVQATAITFSGSDEVDEAGRFSTSVADVDVSLVDASDGGTTDDDLAEWSRPLAPGTYWFQVAATDQDVVRYSEPRQLTIRKWSGKPRTSTGEEEYNDSGVDLPVSLVIPTTLSTVPAHLDLRMNGRSICRTDKPLRQSVDANSLATRNLTCRIPYRRIRPKGRNVLQVSYRIGSKATTGRVWSKTNTSRF